MNANKYNIPVQRIIIAFLFFVSCFYSKASDKQRCLFDKVDLLLKNDQIDSATVFLNTIRSQIDSEDDPIFQLAYFDRCSGLQKLKGDFKTALAYYDSISKVIPKVMPKDKADSLLLARGYLSSATLLGEQNRYSESIELYKKAFLYSKAKPNDEFNSYYFQNIGFCYIRSGQVETGLQYINEAFKIYDARKDYAGKFGCVDYIANTMVDYRNFKLAKRYFDIALTLNNSAKVEYQNVSLFNNIGRMYNYEMKFDSALIYFNLALSESKSKKNNYLVAIAETNIGEILIKQEKYDEAILYLNKALSEFNSIPFNLGVFQANHLIAFCEYKRHDLRKTEFFQDQAEKLMQKTEIYPSLLIDFYKRSYELKKGLGKIKESLGYLEKYKCMQDSLNGLLTNWKINEIESRLLTSIKEKQLIEKDVELERHRLVVGIVVALLILTFILTVITSVHIRKRRYALYEKQLAKITALRLQNTRNSISPHFFFNVLGSLSGLSAQPEKLRLKLKSLTYLLRKVIENIDQIAVPLESELEAVKAYVDLYKERIPDPFTVEYSINENVDMDCLIPAMIIQIPVENAIKHGLMPLEGEKRLSVSVIGYAGYQQVTVSDNGIGRKASVGSSTGTGTGLKVLLQTILSLCRAGL